MRIMRARWQPAALRIVSNLHRQKRFNTPYMPWPYDKYKRPGSAKYWLAKYPPADASQDAYEQELIYLDELDKRVNDAAQHYQPSERWKKAYNEYNWENHDNVTETYGSIGGDYSQELISKYGRGSKIDPSHYISPKYYKLDRNSCPSQYVHPDLRKRLGPLKNMLSLPPEEPSVFKLWNVTNLAGACAAIAFSKEYFMISHDFWHGIVFWMAWALIISVGVDWWSWWHVLRGQEWYDHAYFPLNEKVERMFENLNNLEDRPSLAKQMALMVPYVKEISDRCIIKANKDNLAVANVNAIDKLEAKLKEESGTKTHVLNTFKEQAFQETLKSFENDKVKKTYLANVIKMLPASAEFKPGKTVTGSGSTVFDTKYNELLSGYQDKYMTEKRSQGTLPWVFATEAEIKAKRLSADEIKKKYRAKVDAFEQKYHKVSVVTL